MGRNCEDCKKFKICYFRKKADELFKEIQKCGLVDDVDAGRVHGRLYNAIGGDCKAIDVR